MFSGIPDSVKLKNADNTTGREGAGSVVCFSLANEDFGLLGTIASSTGQFQFVGGRLKVDAELDASSITIGNVKLQDGTSGALGVVRNDGSENALVVTQNSQPLPTGAATQATLLAARTDIGSILAGMATAANQGTEIVSLAAIQTSTASIDGKLNSLGQKLMAASVPVVLASDEVVPISAASLPLPTGAATEGTLASVLSDLDKFTFLAGLLRVDGSGVTQPVSATALPLPAGAATSANQVTENASLASIDGKLPPSLGQQLSSASLGVVIASDQSAVPVTATSLPLPAGAATAANQVTGNGSLSSIDSKLTGVALDSSLQSILTDTNKFTFASTRLLTDGSGVTQPVSATSLPLPVGAATSALQTSGNASLASVDGKLNSLGQKLMAGSVPVVLASDQSAIPVTISSSDFNVDKWGGTSTTLGQKLMAASVPVVLASDEVVPISAASLPLPTGAATAANQGTEISSLASIDGKLTTTVNGLKVDGSAVTQPVSATSLPLPAGAATAANQTTANASLSSIDGKLNSLGQKVMASSVPVVLASDETVPISAASLPLPTGAATEVTLAAALVDLNKFTFSATRLLVDGSGVTQPVSAVSLPLPTGAATSANQSTANTSLASIDGKLPAIGQHTMAASLSVVVASDQSAVPISAASLPLPTGASTSANQTTANTSLSSIDGKLNSLGQKAMVGSVPVAIASDQGAVPISAASLPLPTGASTAANQTTGNTSLSSIDGKLNSLGQKAMAGSVPVAIASDQGAVPISAASLPLPTGASTEATLASTLTELVDIEASLAPLSFNGAMLKVDASGTTVPISAASLPLPTGAATSANQTTANTSLASIDGKLGSLGQKVMSGSAPVVIASDQSPLLPPSDLSASGTIVATNGSVAVSVHGVNSAIISLSGTWVASIQFQGMTPDGNWSNLTSALLPSGGLFSSAVVTVNGSYRLVSAAGYSQLRATATAYTSGTVNVAINVASGQYVVQPVQLTAANLNAQVVGGTADGAAWTGNPVVVGGKDESGNAKSITSTLVDGKQSFDASLHPGNVASYMASTNGEVTTGTTLNTVNSIAYLWHPNTVTKRYEIAMITASINSLSANVGYVSLRGARITALNGTPGGTNQTTNAVDQADAATGSTFTTGATGAPTRATGDYSTYNFGCASANNNGQSAPMIMIFDEKIAGKPIVLRASTNEGYEVRTNIGTALTTGVPVSVTFYWREI